MQIRGAVAVVTGASGGIGEATARELSSRGATTVLAARSEDKLAALAREMPGSLPVPTDMRRPDDVANLMARAKGAFGHIDILVNNAGQGLRAPVEKIDLAEYRAIMELNVFAVLEAMQAAIPLMRSQGKGLILNVGSMVSKNYFPGLAAYASTKYALNALSLTAREELAESGITVCVFHPRLTATKFGEHALGTPYDSSSVQPGMGADTPQEVAERIADQIENEDAEAMMG